MEVSDQPHAQATLPPQGKRPSMHWIRDWVGIRAGLETVLILILSPLIPT